MAETAGILVTGLSEAEEEALEDFRLANGIGSLGEVVRDLCRAGLVARRFGAPKPTGAFRWVERRDRMIDVYCGGTDIGWIMPVDDERGVLWRITDVAGSKYRPPVHGEATSVESAKIALREAWTRWLADRSLGELVPAGTEPAAAGEG